MAAKSTNGRRFKPVLLPGGQQGEEGNGTAYNESEFLVGKHGVNGGESVKETFRIHEGYAAEAGRYLLSGKFPYNNYSDVWRHAAVRHINWLATLEGEMDGSVLHELRQIDEIVARQQFQLRFLQSIEAIENVVREISHTPGGNEEIGRMVRRMKKQIDAMRPSFWRAHYEKMFMRAFGVYLSAGMVVLSAGSSRTAGGDYDENSEEDYAAGIPTELLQVVRSREEWTEEDEEDEHAYRVAVGTDDEDDG